MVLLIFAYIENKVIDNQIEPQAYFFHAKSSTENIIFNIPIKKMSSFVN